MMRRVTIVCGAAALGWTVVSFAAYSDFGLAFQTSLPAWLIYGVVWIGARLRFTVPAKAGGLTRRQPEPERHRLAVAGAIAGVLVLTFLTVQWLGKKDKRGDKNPAIALKSEPAPAATEQDAPPAKQPDTEPTAVRPQAETTVAQKAAVLWTVQVAAFKSEQAAFKLAAALKNRGWEAHVTSVDVNAATVYRTQVGRFRTRAAAEKLLVKLKDREAYTTAFVVGI